MTRSTATLTGLVAILLWAMLALFTLGAKTIPPFQLAAMSLFIGGLVGAVTWLFRPGAARALRQPASVWMLGIYGIFLYHAVYFAALKLAPAAEVSLIAYLWPLLIVVFSGLLPGEGLKAHHLIGVFVGFAGVVVLALGRGDLAFRAEYMTGYVLAGICALVWSSYSVASARIGQVPTDVVTGFCLVSSVLAAICHLALETTIIPADLTTWLAVLALGLGPTGIAFFVWDIGMKQGDLRTLGAASYATPLLSTLILVLAGQASASWPLFVAAALIGAGGLYAAKDSFARKGG